MSSERKNVLLRIDPDVHDALARWASDAFALLLACAVGSDLLHGKAPLLLASAVVWLVLGHAFYCWLHAAAGSMAERDCAKSSPERNCRIAAIAAGTLTG